MADAYSLKFTRNLLQNYTAFPKTGGRTNHYQGDQSCGPKMWDKSHFYLYSLRHVYTLSLNIASRLMFCFPLNKKRNNILIISAPDIQNGSKQVYHLIFRLHMQSLHILHFSLIFSYYTLNSFSFSIVYKTFLSSSIYKDSCRQINKNKMFIISNIFG